jgi:AcrR family transcriptional regulator
MAEPPPPTRRERLRVQTLGEIKTHALEQISQEGAEGLSLSAIARSMGMSGPALYRYFASRDELLAALVADSYAQLADTLEAAVQRARRRAPAARFRALAAAYRSWALEHPHRYRLVFATTYGSGLLAPDQTIPPAQRNMHLILEALAALDPPVGTGAGEAGALDAQLERWARSRSVDGDLPPALLELGVLTWTRLHGILSLEIEGVFASMGIDPALLFAAEVDHLIDQRGAQAG